MKHIKSLIADAKELSNTESEALNTALWNLICYSPRIPNRLHQQQLEQEASTFQVKVFDEHFSNKALVVQGYKWGSGPLKILLTHGWASKALDFFELISILKENKDLEIYAFDAPGNGSSEGGLTNLLLYIKAIKAIIQEFGIPDILLGHSLGAMANILVVNELRPVDLQLLISLSPLIKLKENFVFTMNSVNSSAKAQERFFKSFEEKFNTRADAFDLTSLYADSTTTHLVAYDINDIVSPYIYMKEFLSKNPEMITLEFAGIDHGKMHKDAQVLNKIIPFIKNINEIVE